MRHRWLVIALVTSGVFAHIDTEWVVPARAQNAVPLDLAALALRPGDVPEPGWAHAGAFVEDPAGQAAATASYRGDGTTAEEATEDLASFGWQRMYVSVLDSPADAIASPVADGNAPAGAPARRIRSYVAEYGSVNGATAGFVYMEDETGIPTADDVPGSRRFGEQSELTADAGTSGIDGRSFESLDLTFRVGSLVAGVTVITYGATAASPAVAEVEPLAAVLEGRLLSPPQSPGFFLHVSRVVGAAPAVLTYDDAYYRLGGADVPLADEASDAAERRIAGYAGATDAYQLWQGVGVGTPDGVLYGVTALRFPDEAAAQAWLDRLASTLGQNPFYGGLRPVELPGDLPYPAVALRYVSGGGSPDAPHALLVAVRVGAEVARVHVVPQGRLADVPLDPVLDLAGVAAACLAGPDCPALPALPGGLGGSAAGNPIAVASPMSP